MADEEGQTEAWPSGFASANAPMARPIATRQSVLQLQPITRETVVTTITRTTVHYPPIQLARPPSPDWAATDGERGYHDVLEGKRRHPLVWATEEVPRMTDDGETRPGTGRLRADHADLQRFRKFGLAFDAKAGRSRDGVGEDPHDTAGDGDPFQATYDMDGPLARLHPDQAERGPSMGIDRKGKRRARSEEETEDHLLQRTATAPALATSARREERSNSQQPPVDERQPRKKARTAPSAGIVSNAINALESRASTMRGAAPSRSPEAAVHHGQADRDAPISSSSGIPLPTGDNVQNTPVLPSPMVSPRPSPEPETDAQRASRIGALVHKHNPTVRPHMEVESKEVINDSSAAACRALSTSLELPVLLSLPSMVHEFASLAPSVQTHILYSMLRHSSVSVLRSISSLITPALKKDFLSDLPPELSLLVLGYLDGPSVVRCSAVSKNWQRFVNQHGQIWENLLKTEGLWIADGDRKSDEREAARLGRANTELCNGSRRKEPLQTEMTVRDMLNLPDEGEVKFMKMWQEDTWDERFSKEWEARPTEVKIAEATAQAGRPKARNNTVHHWHSGPDHSKPQPKLRRSNMRPDVGQGVATSLSKRNATLSSVSMTRSLKAAAAKPSLAAARFPKVATDSVERHSAADYVHPLKLLYKKRHTVTDHWSSPSHVPHRLSLPAGHSSVVTALQFDSEKVVFASDNPNIEVYDITTGQQKMRLEGHDGGIWALQYIGNVLVSGSTDRTLRVWDLDKGSCTHVFGGHTSTVRCLQIVEPVNVNPDVNGPPVWEPPYPLIVTGSRDWTLRIWRLPNPSNINSTFVPYLPTSAGLGNHRHATHHGPYSDPWDNPYHLGQLRGHDAAVRALAAHGRTLISGSYDCTLRVWDLLTQKCRHKLVGHSTKVYSVMYDHERLQCASGSMDGTVRLWSTETGQQLHNLDGHSSLVGLLGLSYHYLVSAGADSTLKIWNPATGQCIDTLQAHAGAITCFKHDEFKVVSGSENQLRVWDIRSGSAVRNLMNDMHGVWQVQFSDRHVVAAVQRDGQTEYEIIDFFPELRAKELRERQEAAEAALLPDSEDDLFLGIPLSPTDGHRDTDSKLSAPPLGSARHGSVMRTPKKAVQLGYEYKTPTKNKTVESEGGRHGGSPVRGGETSRVGHDVPDQPVSAIQEDLPVIDEKDADESFDAEVEERDEEDRAAEGSAGGHQFEEDDEEMEVQE